ncbi:MAG: MBL fold metallo-hydrolase [Planctomycetota bacterium]
MPLDYQQIVTTPFDENTWLLKCTATRRFAVVDPGNGSVNRVRGLINDGWTCERILLTHAHLDHVWDLPAVKELTGAPIHMHQDDVELLGHAPYQAAMFGIPGDFEMPPAEAANFLDTGDTVMVGETSLWVFQTPGHSPGSICFYRGGANPRVVPGEAGHESEWRLECEHPDVHGECIVGDLVICESVGRTDLPGGSERQLLHSILNRLFALPPQTQLHAGHCKSSSIAHERRHNQVVGGR